MTEEEKEMLIRVDERTQRIDTWCSNHDVHHFRYNIMAWGIALTAIVSLIIVVLNK